MLKYFRLTLIASDQGITGALFILSIFRILLIYLNYRFWLMKWTAIYENFLDNFVAHRDDKRIQMVKNSLIVDLFIIYYFQFH